MLNIGGIVVLDDANWPSIRKLCHYISTNLSYSIINGSKFLGGNFKKKRSQVQCSKSDNLFLQYRSFFNWVRFSIQKINPKDKILLSSMVGSLIAFKKESKDSRKWDFHKKF